MESAAPCRSLPWSFGVGAIGQLSLPIRHASVSLFSPCPAQLLTAFPEAAVSESAGEKIAIAFAWLPPHLDRLNRWSIDGDAVRYLGLIITAIGGFVRVATVFELGHRFSIFVAVQPDHRLKTDGFYRFVRHPSYLGALLAMVGWALVFRSIIGLFLTAAICVPIIARIRAEEDFLVREFGDQYRGYQQRTRWRLFPFVY